MIWLEMIGNSRHSLSEFDIIWRYFKHGFVLGLILIPTLVVITLGFGYLFVIMVIFGPISLIALIYGILFALVGGVNQILVKRLWGIECEENIGTGMRDGSLIIILFGIVYVPMNLLFLSTYIRWWFVNNPLEAIITFFFTTFIYMLILGVLGQKIATFLYVDEEPIIPTDFHDRSYTCPHCGSSYYYHEDSVVEGHVNCQNCAKKFAINHVG